MKLTKDNIKEWRGSIIAYIGDMWGLIPQPLICNEEHQHNVKCYGEFVKGKHITWQQTQILEAVEKGFTVAAEAKDIKVGDKILGRNNLVKVIGVFPQKKQKAHRVTFDDGSFLDVGGQHLWTIRGRNSRRIKTLLWETITTEEIIERGVKRKNGTSTARQWEIPRLSVEGFEHHTHAYVLGIWIGDGHIHSPCYTKYDTPIADKIRSLGWMVRTVGGRNTVYGLNKVLREYGIFGSKKHLPDNFLSWDKMSRSELLKGLCDTDGTIGKKNNNIEFGTIHETLAIETLMLIRSLGGKGRITIKEFPHYIYQGEKRTGKRYYRVSFQTPFNPFFLPRKAQKWFMPQARYLSRWIDSIERIEDISGVCFKVDAEDELFIAGKDFIVTHNTALLDWFIHWFLMTRKNSQIGATSPTADQLFDVLWKEVAVWKSRLPENIQSLFEYSSSHYRIAESTETWFARAKTARKEAPEAFAGLHSDAVALLGDEASGIPNEIYRTGEGSLTNKDTFVILISNFTRLEGYFYDTHNSDIKNWQTFNFSSLDSPIVEQGFAERIAAKYGESSDEYRYMVLGLQPKGENMQDGWLPMFSEDDIQNQVQDVGALTKPAYLGVDPSGYGKNKSAWVVRDAFK